MKDNTFPATGKPLFAYTESALRSLLNILNPDSQRYAEVEEELNGREFTRIIETETEDW